MSNKLSPTMEKALAYLANNPHATHTEQLRNIRSMTINALTNRGLITFDGDRIQLINNSEQQDTQAQAQAELDAYVCEQADAVAPEPLLSHDSPEFANDSTQGYCDHLRWSDRQQCWVEVGYIPKVTVVEDDDNSEPAPDERTIKMASFGVLYGNPNMSEVFVSGSSPRNRRTQQQLANRTVRRRANRFFRELAKAA